VPTRSQKLAADKYRLETLESLFSAIQADSPDEITRLVRGIKTGDDLASLLRPQEHDSAGRQSREVVSNNSTPSQGLSQVPPASLSAKPTLCSDQSEAPSGGRDVSAPSSHIDDQAPSTSETNGHKEACCNAPGTLTNLEDPGHEALNKRDSWVLQLQRKAISCLYGTTNCYVLQ
jgi:hypothetical protein